MQLPQHEGKLHAAVKLWSRSRLDIVCIQETHHTSVGDSRLLQRGLHQASQYLGTPGWEVVAQSLSDSARTAGVAVLIRTDLLQRAKIVTVPDRLTPRDPPPGRGACVSLRWEGHTVHIANIYLHTGAYQRDRRDMIQRVLEPIAAAAMGADDEALIWAGDFNFVEAPLVDSTAGEDGRRGDRPVAQDFRQGCGYLADTYRCLHPQRRDFSHWYHAPRPGASRLDRIYVSQPLLPFLISAAVVADTPSDHRLATVAILPRTPQAKGPGIPRVRTRFLAYRDLREELQEWTEHQCGMRPEEDAGILAWWPPFKRRLAAKVESLNRAAVRRRTHSGHRGQQAIQAAQQAQEAADANPGPQTLRGMVDAQTEVIEALREDGAVMAREARVMWLREGERPNKRLTAMVRPPQAATSVVALQAPSGRLVTLASKIPDVVADYWQEVCKPPEGMTLTAREQVLEALRARANKIPEERAEAIGQAEVSEGEVMAALKAAKIGKAPGWDGLPMDVYKAVRGEIAATMAEVFSVIGRTGGLPTAFLDGVITVLYKGRGPLTAPGNYRPITLLCTDYRLVTKILANRLGPGLGGSVSPEQAAFLPGRLIGANIMFLRFLPHVLKQGARTGLVAFLDIAKAYDSLDRDFLYGAMEAMGAGAGLLKWARTLLTTTTSFAVVNGFRSKRVPLKAGVRQGCPLAPMLYLFAAQALLCWLQHCQIGIHLPPGGGERTTAVQFADDTEVLLEGPEVVPRFLECMDIFAQASGQRLNLDKVELLPLDSEGAAQPATIAGLTVVSTANALGLPFTDVGREPRLDWSEKLATVRERLQKLSTLSLSIFGRATAAASYGLHRVTWHMEHGGLPPDHILADIQKWQAALLDRGLGPDAAVQRGTGVPKSLLPGHPTTGGFGALPLREHVHARWAVWAVRFALGEPPGKPMAPWSLALRSYLRGLHPAFAPLAMLTARLEPPWVGAPWLPDDIRRITTALAHLPPVVEVGDHPLCPGDWCAAAPVWGNPLLPVGRGALDRPGLEYRHASLVSCLGLLTLGDLVAVVDAIRSFRDEWRLSGGAPAGFSPREDRLLGRQWRAIVVLLGPSEDIQGEYVDWRRWDHHLTALQGMEADVPEAWCSAARAARAHTAPVPGDAVQAAVALLVTRLGWNIGGKPVPLRQLTVKLATQLQLRPYLDAQMVAHTRFLQEASGLEAGVPVADGVLAALRGNFSRMWQTVRWENAEKETYWRLAVDGIPLGGNSHMRNRPVDACACGLFPSAATSGHSPRQHHFWGCPVACAVVNQISVRVGAPVGRSQLWLARPPPGLEQCVWDVTVLAACSAIEMGRRYLRSAPRRPISEGAPLLDRGVARALADFWSRMRGFARLGVPRQGWGSVGPSHPLLRVVNGLLICDFPAFATD